MSHVELMLDSTFNLDTVFISPQTMLRENRSFYVADFRGHFDEMVYSTCAYNTVPFNPSASMFLVSGILDLSRWFGACQTPTHRKCSYT